MRSRTSMIRPPSRKSRKALASRCREWTLRRCRSRLGCNTAVGDLLEQQVQHLRHARPGQCRHPKLLRTWAFEVALRCRDDNWHVREQRPDFVEEPTLVVQRIAAGFRNVQEKQNAIREMGEGRDGLSLHLVPLVHRPVEKARGIEDLVAVYAAVKVAERHPFRRE